MHRYLYINPKIDKLINTNILKYKVSKGHDMGIELDFIGPVFGAAQLSSGQQIYGAGLQR